MADRRAPTPFITGPNGGACPNPAFASYQQSKRDRLRAKYQAKNARQSRPQPHPHPHPHPHLQPQPQPLTSQSYNPSSHNARSNNAGNHRNTTTTNLNHPGLAPPASALAPPHHYQNPPMDKIGKRIKRKPGQHERARKAAKRARKAANRARKAAEAAADREKNNHRHYRKTNSSTPTKKPKRSREELLDRISKGSPPLEENNCSSNKRHCSGRQSQSDGDQLFFVDRVASMGLAGDAHLTNTRLPAAKREFIGSASQQTANNSSVKSEEHLGIPKNAPAVLRSCLKNKSSLTDDASNSPNGRRYYVKLETGSAHQSGHDGQLDANAEASQNTVASPVFSTGSIDASNGRHMPPFNRVSCKRADAGQHTSLGGNGNIDERVDQTRVQHGIVTHASKPAPSSDQNNMVRMRSESATNAMGPPPRQGPRISKEPFGSRTSKIESTEMGSPAEEEASHANGFAKSKTSEDAASGGSELTTGENDIIDLTMSPSKKLKSDSASDTSHKATSSRGVGSEHDMVDLSEDPDKTHVIFAVDFSGSMNKRDVWMGRRKGKISRWAAVFECVDSFLTQQLEQHANTMSTCIVSLVIFNDQSEVLLKRMPLVGDGSDIRQALKTAKENHQPCGGTGFAAGFHRADQLTRSEMDDKVILVFLSDGRPGDLKSEPPGNPSLPMQKTFKRNGLSYIAAGHYIERMRHGQNDFNLQLICLYNEGVPWLQYLANRYNGTFHNPDLRLEDAVATPHPFPSKHTGEKGCNVSEEDIDVQIVKVKSQEALVRERMQVARATGKIVSLTAMSTNATSIRSTFSSISATVTAMRSRTKLEERAVTIKSESAMISYQATRMVLKIDGNGIEKFVVAAGEIANGRRISVSISPFARGGLRNVYRMKQESEGRQVAKESRHDIKYNERLKFHLETSKCQSRASKYAHFFNNKITLARRKSQTGQQAHPLVDVPHIDVLSAEVYRLKAPSCPGGFRYLAVEKCLEGKYEKWNNNDGFVNQSDCLKCKVAQAFSHFSYERSSQHEMVVDIQGSTSPDICTYTDPQLHSVNQEFGRADRGTVGINNFFKTHKCNFICQELGLQPHSGPL